MIPTLATHLVYWKGVVLPLVSLLQHVVIFPKIEKREDIEEFIEETLLEPLPKKSGQVELEFPHPWNDPLTFSIKYSTDPILFGL